MVASADIVVRTSSSDGLSTMGGSSRWTLASDALAGLLSPVVKAASIRGSHLPLKAMSSSEADLDGTAARHRRA